MSSSNSTPPSKGSITKSSSDTPVSPTERNLHVGFRPERDTVLAIPSENKGRPIIPLKNESKKQTHIEGSHYIWINKARIERGVLVTHEDATDDWEVVDPHKDHKDHDTIFADGAENLARDEPNRDANSK
ncbi:hypothetical protein ACHAPU_010338 [Fusarium lateritium]